ncbi:MAG: hypothetical protein LOY00_00105 [Methylocaldum sp.]|nr:hypothetical protein [Methylocaldum sp.]
MDVFTEVYDKSIELLKTSSLQKDWKDIESGLKKLLQSDGPSVDAAPVLDKLRKQLEEAAKGKAEKWTAADVPGQRWRLAVGRSREGESLERPRAVPGDPQRLSDRQFRLPRPCGVHQAVPAFLSGGEER